MARIQYLQYACWIESNIYDNSSDGQPTDEVEECIMIATIKLLSQSNQRLLEMLRIVSRSPIETQNLRKDEDKNHSDEDFRFLNIGSYALNRKKTSAPS